MSRIILVVGKTYYKVVGFYYYKVVGFYYYKVKKPNDYGYNLPHIIPTNFLGYKPSA